MSVCVLPGFLSPEECSAAIALFPPSRPAVVHAAKGLERRPVRRGKVAFLTPGAVIEAVKDGLRGALVDKIHRVMLQANADVFRFDIAATEPIQLATYDEGDGYGWHLDIGPGPAARRKLSATVQLTPPGEYDGGALEVWGAASIDRSQGAVVIFPSYMPHRVTPITRGTRRALVAWASGETPFK